MAIVLGLLASLLIGGSDFLGAHSTGRTTALQTTTAAFLGGAIAALMYSPVLGTPSARDLLLGALSGVLVAVALTTLWRAYTDVEHRRRGAARRGGVDGAAGAGRHGPW